MLGRLAVLAASAMLGFWPGIGAGLVAAQQGTSQAPQDQAPKFKSAVDLVSVSAVVRDKKGRFVPHLSREDFIVVDSQLGVDIGSGAPEPVFVAATGERLRVSVPDGYDGEAMGLFQWLDEDRFALVVLGTAGIGNVPTGDLLVCRIAAGQCRTVASGEQYWLLPGPHGGVGAEG